MRDRIEEALEAGKKNQRAKELMQNWCAHARIVKFGGTGMVEAQTGLPIGHHSIECDYAEARGMATWFIADAALDFHDRNCVDCKYRAPVRLPNLTELLSARDERRRKRSAAEERQAKKASEALAARQRVRAELRHQLDAIGRTVIDHLDEFDRERRTEASEALVNTAKLAPETFTTPLIEHFFSLLTARERWFDACGLRVLQELRASPARLTNCALLSLAEHSSVDVAATILEVNAELIDAALVTAAFPALVLLADPPHSPVMTERHLRPEPLQALHAAHPRAVDSAIRHNFDTGTSAGLRIACRAIVALSARDSSIAARFARDLAAKLARADRLDDDELSDRGLNGVVDDLQRALAQAIHQAPDETDSLTLDFLEGARGPGQAHLLTAYREVLSVHWRGREPISVTRAHTIALKRLLWAATTIDDHNVMREVQSGFYGSPYELLPLARQEIEGLLGAALLLDDRLNAPQAERKVTASRDALAGLEAWSHRSDIHSLMTTFIKWAAEAAADDREALERYIALLAGVPASRESIRAALLTGASPLTRTPEGLAIVLPHLYSAMVGTPNRMRAAGAELLEEMDYKRRDDLPLLVLEALVMQLSDPYVIVHQAAVEALSKIELPDSLAPTARLAVWTLISVYANDGKSDDFLFKCIRVFARRYAGEQELRTRAGQYLISLMEKMRPYVLNRELAYLPAALQANDAFAPFLLRLLAHPETSEHSEDEIFRAMRKLAPKAVHEKRAAFAAAGAALSDWRHLPLIEVLTNAAAWEEAAELAEVAYNKIPDTKWHRPRRLLAKLETLATKFEMSLAAGDLGEVHRLATEWKKTRGEIEQDNRKNEERRDPLRGLRSSD